MIGYVPVNVVLLVDFGELNLACFPFDFFEVHVVLARPNKLVLNGFVALSLKLSSIFRVYDFTRSVWVNFILLNFSLRSMIE